MPYFDSGSLDSFSCEHCLLNPQDARSCRKLCQDTVGCNAWLYCWHAGGCDDGVTSDRRRYPFNGCELLSLQHVSLLCASPKLGTVIESSPLCSHVLRMVCAAKFR